MTIISPRSVWRLALCIFVGMLVTAPACAGVDVNPYLTKAPVVSVKAFGAVGDGVIDDQQAITAAASKVAADGGGTLLFPPGTYRCGRSMETRDGVTFKGVSNLAIVFQPGAELLLDNLDPQTGRGDRGHGIHIAGPCTNVWVVGAHVKWKTLPSGRSLGDGFRFAGYPSDDRTISHIHFIDCESEQCPQTGAIFMGCSDVTVRNFRVLNNLADGLHFNACRRVDVNGEVGINNGDDTLAFVTYFDPTNVAPQNRAEGPFSQPTLGEWNDTDSEASNIDAEGGRADGVRLAGANGVTLSNVHVINKSCGVIADSGLAEPPRYSWGYMASRGIAISGLSVVHCDTGLLVWDYDVPQTDQSASFWKFDLSARDLSIAGCTNDSVHLWGVAGVNISHVQASGQRIRVRLSSDCSLSEIDLKGAPFIVSGADSSVADLSALPLSHLNFGAIRVDGGGSQFERCSGITIASLSVTNAPAGAVVVSNVANVAIGSVQIDDANRSASPSASALSILGSQQVTITQCSITQDQIPLKSFEIGGGGPAGVSKDVRIDAAKYQSADSGSGPELVLQGGEYAPQGWYIKLAYLHSGAPDASWQDYSHALDAQ